MAIGEWGSGQSSASASASGARRNAVNFVVELRRGNRFGQGRRVSGGCFGRRGGSFAAGLDRRSDFRGAGFRRDGRFCRVGLGGRRFGRGRLFLSFGQVGGEGLQV